MGSLHLPSLSLFSLDNEMISSKKHSPNDRTPHPTPCMIVNAWANHNH